MLMSTPATVCGLSLHSRALSLTNAGFPPDDDAKRLFVALQDQGIPVGAWLNPPVEDTAYFACPREAIGRVNEPLSAMEKKGEFEEGFCARRTEHLFSLLEKST